MNKVSIKAASLIGSEIIKLGNEIQQKIKQGYSIYNLTIGDFNPKLFPIPDKLKEYIIEAYQNGETNYPAADGMPELKVAVIEFLKRYEGLLFSNDEVLIAGGGRPLIHGVYQAIVDPGDKVLYPVPSWNNNHYCHLADAQKIEIPTLAEDGFMPTAAELAPHLSEVVLVALCSPLNPTGTTFKASELKKICDLIVAENKQRASKRKPLYLLYDQIYWTLMADGFTHVNPIALCPEMKPYTLFVDGISKSLSATGVRVGWGMGPAEIISKMKGFIGHIGAWAPRAEQVATANFLNDVDAVNEYLLALRQKINSRFEQLYLGICELKDEGFPVNIIKPEGAIYLSVQFRIIGRKRKDGTLIVSSSDITQFLLDEAELAIVPFTAFGCEAGTDWFRISVGTLPQEEIGNLLSKLRKGLSNLL
jgi:aspartate aminotransferase